MRKHNGINYFDKKNILALRREMPSKHLEQLARMARCRFKSRTWNAENETLCTRWLSMSSSSGKSPESTLLPYVEIRKNTVQNT
jgi:hypothetical protein